MHPGLNSRAAHIGGARIDARIESAYGIGMQNSDTGSPDTLILSGGKQRVHKYDLDEWTGYSTAVALRVDLANGAPKVVDRLDYLSPPELISDEPDASITFKSGAMIDDGLWLTTQTEVLHFDPASFELQQRISLPVFNDVHHVMRSSRDTLVVTATGLDAIFEVSMEGELINEWSTYEKDIWCRFDKATDYRKVLTTKPHSVHPNFCLEHNGNYWVTRLQPQDAYCVQTGQTIPLPAGKPHDGNVDGDIGHYTHVNGHISRVDFAAGKVLESWDLNEASDGVKHIGWCRGIHALPDDRFIVGFTRIRPSKYRLGVEWLKNRVGAPGWPGCHPTRIALFNAQEARFEWELDLEEHGINAVFSILPRPA